MCVHLLACSLKLMTMVRDHATLQCHAAALACSPAHIPQETLRNASRADMEAYTEYVLGEGSIDWSKHGDLVAGGVEGA